MRKLVLIGFCLFLTGAMVFATGSRQPAASTGTPTLQIGIDQAGNVTEFENNYLTQYLEKFHNVKLEFITFSGAELATRLALMAASDDLPETIWSGGVSSATVLNFGQNGFFLPLNRYFNDASRTPYFNRLPEADRKSMLDTTASADGNNYGFPTFNPNAWNSVIYRLRLNFEWLAKLGLQTPRTTDELRNVLIAFRDRDPNGNGRRDELPVFGQVSNGWGTDVCVALINSFVYYHPGYRLALDASGNNVTAPFTEAGFRRGLQYLNGLYRDGLFDPGSFTTDTQNYRLILNANPSVVGLTVTGSNGNFTNLNLILDTPPVYDIVRPFSSPGVPGYTPYDLPGASNSSFITNKAKNVDLAVKVMDSFYEPTLSIICQYGEENVNWSRDPAFMADVMSRGFINERIYLGMSTSLTFVTLNDTWNVPTNLHWGTQNPRYWPEEMNAGWTNYWPDAAPFDGSRIKTDDHWMNYLTMHPERLLPELKYSLADSETLAQPITNIGTYINQSIAEFTTGVRDINSDTAWNAYLRELDNMGLQQWLRIAQATYNRQR